MVRRFGSSEDEAMSALRDAIVERVGTVTEPVTPLGEPVTMQASEADRLIISAREGMRRFAAQVYSSHRFVAPGSDAAGDAERSGSDIVPVSIVDGFVAAIVDHLQAWVDKTGGHDGDPQLWLSLYSDYTLFRPILESLAAAIWILGPDDSRERIKNATKLLATEHEQANRYIQRINRVGHPDPFAEQVNSGLDRIIGEVCERMGFNPAQIRRAVDPSSLPDKASRFVPGAGSKFYRLWALCSAHAHAQLFTVMRAGARTSGTGPYGGWTYVEADSESFAELVRFTGYTLSVLAKLLNRRGHMLNSETGPRPGADS
jgi:hypothetical protein